MRFDGQVVLISGASSGIGAEFARQFHALGANVLLVARREDRLRDLAQELNQARSASAEYLAIDLCDFRRDVSGGIEELVAKIGRRRIDILVNNAGRGSFGFFEKLQLAAESDLVTLNINASMRLAHAVIPQMKARRSGGIISISSLAAFQPLPLMATYAASKAFNFFHSLALRYELAQSGVRVLVVCPGPTDTEFGGVARVPGTATGVRRDTVDLVVRQSIAAYAANRPFVIPGQRAFWLSLLIRLMPKSFSTWLAWKALRPALERT